MRRLLSILALLAVLSVGAVWLVGGEAGLRLAAGLVEHASAGKVAFKGLHGSLLGPIGIDAIEMRGEKRRYDAIGLELDWSPRALWQRQLRIDRLDLAELRIAELKPDAEPPTLPGSLRLPFGLTLSRASIGRLTIKKGLVEYRLSGIELGLDNRAATYRLDLRRLAWAGARFSGRASLADARPFALSGQIRLDHDSGQAMADVTGELDRIGVRAAAGLAGGQASADLTIAPFTPRPLVEARIAATDIDPAAWDPALAKADIDLDASLRSAGASAYAGTVDLRNGLPDAWDRGRLPLRRLTADYTGTADKMDLHALRLDLGQGGQFSGGGQVEGEHLVLDLATRDFDPHGLHSRMRSLRLAGTIQLKADRSRQHLLADLNYQRYRLHLDAEQRDRVLHIAEATLGAGTGRLSLYGSLGLDAARPFDLAGALEGFDPAAFGAYPSAQVNASFNTAGHIQPEIEAAIGFAIADSRFRQQPLSGQGSVQVSARRLWDSRVDLRLADNRLRLDGAFGAPGDRLTFKLQADRPDLIHSALSGRISASGELAGRLAAPNGRVEIRAQDLAWGRDYRLAGLQADARIDQGLAGAMALNARLAGLALPRLKIDQASAHAQGRRDRHSLNLAARGPDFDLDAELSGAWRDATGQSGWTGQLLHLGNRGRHPLALLAPAGLELAPDRVRLTDARVAALGAQIRIDEARYQAGAFASRGAFQGLGLASLRGLANWPEELSGDLILAGDWRVDAGAQVDGRLSIERERGDLTVTADAPIRLGLQRLSLVAEASGNRLQASLEADGATLGRLRAQGESRLSRRDGQWGLAGDTPIQASADLALQSLAWAAPLLDKSGAIRLDGKLSAQVRADGHLSAPHYTGTISGTGLSLALPAQGVKLDQGRFDAELRQDTLELKSFSLRGGQGSVTGQGRLAMRAGQPDLKIGLKADQLTLLSSPERLLILSGDGDIALRAGRIELGGRLRADRGQFELADRDSLSRSDDVVVLGRPAKATRALPYVIDSDFDLDLGERFHLEWRGLDADLAGSVRLVGRRNAPLRAAGSIRVAKGTYSAYGQRLEIERGILNFQGPLDNPGLNIQAMRKNQDVSAGVAITGSGRAPVVRLVSQPDLPDSEKLAWLVLGHGLADANAGGKDIDALQLAAGALLGMGKSVSLQQRLAQATGLEDISLKGAGTLEGSVVSLGKRLSSRAYLAYEQGLAGTSGLIKIDYTLSKRLSVRAQAGTTPAVDLFYTFSFD